MTQIKEHELIKAVFATQQGEQLLEFWEQVYGKRMSFAEGNSPEYTAFLEGERNFYLSIINLRDIP